MPFGYPLPQPPKNKSKSDPNNPNLQPIFYLYK